MRISSLISACLLLFSLQGCLNENPPEPFETSPIDPFGRLLHYAEQNGDIVNEFDAYPLISAVEIFQNPGKYLLIDLRSPEKFSAGHIQDANNVAPAEVFDFLGSANLGQFSKIVFISEYGQRAAYITMMAHLYGIENVSFMNFGMAAWHPDFAQEWLDSIQVPFDTKWLTNDRFSKNGFGLFPAIDYDSEKSLKENIQSRVINLVLSKFNSSFVQLTDLTNRFDSITLTFEKTYLVCYGMHGSLYTSGSAFSGDPLPGRGHPFRAAFYSAFSDLQSNESLQTLPIDSRDIILYSYNGQLSSFAAAYLQFLGYNVYSLEFGATRIINPRLQWDLSLRQYAFGLDKNWNLAYVK